MKTSKALILLLFNLIFLSCNQKGNHLFILSGQSNMTRLNNEANFNKLVYDEFGESNVIIVKHAFGGQPIRQWYKGWHTLNGDSTPYQTKLYDQLSRKIKVATDMESIATVSFIWMQGEEDAFEHKSAIYKASLKGLKSQIESDFNYNEMYMVLGRINDYGIGKEKLETSWNALRKVQVEFADENPKVEWVNTDDLNSGISLQGDLYNNDEHLSKAGYDTLGKRFADKAISQIKKADF